MPNFAPAPPRLRRRRPETRAEDSAAETDMTVVMNDAGEFIEVQGTAEGHPFSAEELNAMLNLARRAIAQLIDKQRNALAAEAAA